MYQRYVDRHFNPRRSESLSALGAEGESEACNNRHMLDRGSEQTSAPGCRVEAGKRSLGVQLFKSVSVAVAALASISSVNAVFFTETVIGKPTTLVWGVKSTDAPTEQKIFITLHKGNTWPATKQLWTNLPAQNGQLVTELDPTLEPGNDYWLRVVEIRDDSFDFPRESSQEFALTLP
ncbi:hypothetical protein FA13DRAFT_1913057 [Coprinellus micaceus]|uniref:Uncharacterized protein n=1 Tax=Coprinellus micaceus TaxID=71717 RepID=A0A4Y7SQG9_COPMI|nr:hypothetical protein FA13DRAFT_1913057 [Coprinellus micaceus]